MSDHKRCLNCSAVYYPPAPCCCGYRHPFIREESESVETESNPYEIDDPAQDFWKGYRIGLGLFGSSLPAMFKFLVALCLFGAILKIVFVILGIDTNDI